MKDCVGVGGDTTVTKTTSEVGLGVGDVNVSQSVLSAMSATSAMKTQTRSLMKASGYACGKATQRSRGLEFVRGEEGEALRVTSEAAKCRA